MKSNQHASPASIPAPFDVSDPETRSVGTVTFSTQSDKFYRFKITVTKDTIQIWLEDKKTKEEWETKKLKLEQFAIGDKIIPQASLQDYAKYFCNCMTHDEKEESDEFSRDLFFRDFNRMELHLTLKIKVFHSLWTLPYVFQLERIALETTDILGAQIRDLEEQNENLQETVKNLQKTVKMLEERRNAPKREPEYVRGTTPRSHRTGEVVVWNCDKKNSSSVSIAFASDGRIHFARSGLFSINVAVVNNNSLNSAVFVLQLNKENIACCHHSNAASYYKTSTTCHVQKIAKGDEIRVLYMGNSTSDPNSYIVISEIW